MDDDARRLELSPSLRQLCHPDLDPLFWVPERLGALSGWWGHVPFAHWAIRAARPRVFVELGTHNGVSYAAFCQAVARCQLNTRCFAVDTWKGDAHSSFYGETVYEGFRAFHDERYAAFSTLLRCTFDEALGRIEDGSVDLLHLDGLHTYDAVRHDFQSWLPKLSSRAVALLHDINVHSGDFGVWQLWQELRERHPHFEFHHCYGLGVLALGKEPPEAIAELCALNRSEEGVALRSRVALLGDRWIAEAREHNLRGDLDRERQVRADTDEAYAGIEARLEAVEAARARTEAALAEAELRVRTGNMQRERLEAALAQAMTNVREANGLAEQRKANIVVLQSQNSAQKSAVAEQREQLVRDREQLDRDLAVLRERLRQLELIEQSTIWRGTRILRGAANRLPRPIRFALRRAAKAGYWALTPHRMPARIRFLRDRHRAARLVTAAASGPAAESNTDSSQEAPGGASKVVAGARPLREAANLEERLRASGVFDPEIYLSLNPDVQDDPWEHFLTYGLKERRPFTDPALVARLLAQLNPQIEAERHRFRNAAENTFADPGSRSAARLLRENHIRIGVFCSSLGNFFMREIADMLAWGLRAEGIETIQRDETGNPEEPFDLRVFVAPHEFFWLGQGQEWVRLASAANSVLYNVEQVQTMWFCRAFPLLLEAPLVLDINFHSAAILRQAGCRAIHFMPGHLPEVRYTKPVLDISQVELVKGYPFGDQQYNWQERDLLADRPIDILFVGSRAPRRDKPLARLRELADRHRLWCIYRDPAVPFTQSSGAAAEFSWALAQRAKIVLNIHRDWIGYFEWPRMVMGGFWQGACVVSDPGLFSPIFDAGAHYLEGSLRHIGELLAWLLETEEGRRELDQTRQAGYQRACNVGSMRVALGPVFEAFAAQLQL
jgi:hypothetical protein